MTVAAVTDRLHPATLDLESILEPIAGDNPAGESLRYDGTYDLVREARREDDVTLPQGVWKTEFKKAEWREVAKLCLENLQERSKDLQLAVWLFEAWLNRYGVEGAVGGFRILAGLCENFWDDLYPELEEDDLDGRLSPIEWLNEKVSLELKRVPITEAEGSDERSASWADWEVALFSPETESPADSEDDDQEGARFGRAAILAQVGLTGTNFYKGLANDLAQGNDALAEFETVLRDKCGDEAPSLAELKDILDGMTALVQRVLNERRELEVVDDIETPVSESAGVEAEQDGSGAAAGPATGLIRSRADAYRALSAASDYLMKTEPHSPTPYLVRRAIAWGGMSLADVLKELLKNHADLGTVYALLGIRQPDES